VWNGKKVESGYSEQIFHHAHISKADYESIAASFNPLKFDADKIARLAKSTGMKYIVITAKHHDGFSMFHTKQSKFNVVDATPYGRDIVGLLAQACARHDLKFGVYFSWIDWHCPHALPMSRHNSDPIPLQHMNFNLAQVEELMTNYGSIAEVWFDMGAPTLEQSREMAELVHRLQPRAMVNGRIWNDQGDFAVLGDNQVPDYAIAGPWQTPASIYHSTWGYRSWQEREDLPGKIAELTANMRKVFEMGGNYLLNIGPKGDGSVVEFEEEVLRGIGKITFKGSSIRGIGLSDEMGCETIHLDPGHLNILAENASLPFHHFTGKNYGSCKPVLVERRWLVNSRNTGEYNLFLAFSSGYLDGQTLELSVDGSTFLLTAPPSAQSVLAGRVNLQSDKTCELVLTLRRGANFAENPQELIGVSAVFCPGDDILTENHVKNNVGRKGQ
jgi:alpha-L-fucosidase